MKPLEQAFRDERAAVLATLTRRLGGDLALAEDAVQDAFVAAAVEWDRRGVPARPGAWLTTTARNRAERRIKRTRTRLERVVRQRRREVERVAKRSQRDFERGADRVQTGATDLARGVGEVSNLA